MEMAMTVVDEARWQVFERALPVMAAFERAFDRRLDANFIAELYAARHLGLTISAVNNNPGYDATDANGERYQIKRRDEAVLNVDLNNFAFDQVVLVNLDQDYRLVGLWRMQVSTAQRLFVHREKYRKYQLTQTRFKGSAERLL